MSSIVDESEIIELSEQFSIDTVNDGLSSSINSSLEKHEAKGTSRKSSKDSGLPSSVLTSSDNDDRTSDSSSSVSSSSLKATPKRISSNVADIEALLQRINDENRKTKEVLDSIHRSTDASAFSKETTTKVVLSKGSVISLKNNSNSGETAALDATRKESDQEKTTTPSSSSSITSPTCFYESTIEGKKIPIVNFSCHALSKPLGPNNSIGQKHRLSFKTVNADAKLVSQLCHAHGFHEVHSTNADYNLMWTGVHPKPHSFKSMLPHQRVNHFPRSYELTRKDRLYQNIERLQHAKGIKNFNFVPKTFMIPAEYSEFAAMHHRMRGAWIVKPVASSRGRGIFIVNHPNQVPLDEPMVVGKYIDNPLLVNGHKWDLRLYVVVTSYDPLVVYLYEEGLVRFATVRYDSTGKNLWNPCMHLCNYSINKYHSDYIKCEDPDQEDQGHKWSLSALLRHLKTNHINTIELMQNIEDVIIKSIISVEFPVNSACKMFVPHKRNCFELYGFDILIDSELKPWLLEVNLSPSLNCDAPLDMKIKSAMMSDLLNLVGLPAVDAVLKRAQFNRKVNEMTNANAAAFGAATKDGKDDGKKGSSGSSASSAAAAAASSATANRRTVSVETRRFAAIRLAATSSSYQQELQRMVRNAREENARRGGWVRIFPTPDTWQNYGGILEYSSQNNLILHEHLYPNATRKAQRLNKRNVPTPRSNTFDQCRKRSQSVGSTRSERFSLESSSSQPSPLPISASAVFPTSSSSSSTYLLNSSSGLLASSSKPKLSLSPSLDNVVNALGKSLASCELRKKVESTEVQPEAEDESNSESVKPTACELRVAQYEKPLEKGHKTKRKDPSKKDPENLAKKRSEKRQHSAILRDKIVKMIEGGLQLSEYQSRKAFSVYLHCILQRLSDFDVENGSNLGQIELVLKFLQKAALSLREPYFLKAPSIKLSGKDRAAIVAKELNEFLGHYRRETEVFTVFREESGMVPRHIFEEFIAFANDSDLEDVLTLQTKMYRCAHIFLGKCLPPVTGRKNSLLRTAYGISPDRNLRDKQCSMRMNARANPPIAPQYQLPGQPPAKCLDITTYEKSKLEQLEEVALSNNNIRIGALFKARTTLMTSANRRESVPKEQLHRKRREEELEEEEKANKMLRVCSAPSELNEKNYI